MLPGCNTSSSSQALISQVESGLKRRQDALLHQIFESMFDRKSNKISVERLPDAFRSLAHASGEVDSYLHDFSDLIGYSDMLDFNEFKQAVLKATAIEQWASTLPLPQLLADALPREKGQNPLKLVSELSEEQISNVCRAFLVGLTQVSRCIYIPICFSCLPDVAQKSHPPKLFRVLASTLGC